MENDAAEEDEALPLEALAAPELEQLANRSWGDGGWEDFVPKVSPCRVADQGIDGRLAQRA